MKYVEVGHAEFCNYLLTLTNARLASPSRCPKETLCILDSFPEILNKLEPTFCIILSIRGEQSSKARFELLATKGSI